MLGPYRPYCCLLLRRGKSRLAPTPRSWIIFFHTCSTIWTNNSFGRQKSTLNILFGQITGGIETSPPKTPVAVKNKTKAVVSSTPIWKWTMILNKKVTYLLLILYELTLSTFLVFSVVLEMLLRVLFSILCIYRIGITFIRWSFYFYSTAWRQSFFPLFIFVIVFISGLFIVVINF